MGVLQAVIIGIIQGLTEFLPISSSAHLILVPAFTGWQDQGVAFDLAVHLGTLAAVLLYFRRDVGALTQDATQALLQRRHTGQSRLAVALVIGTLPTGLLGLLLLGVVDTLLRSVHIIIATTVIFSVFLGLADVYGRKQRTVESITWMDALLVGCAQAMALIPGTSRSGATITAGLMLGMTRETASRFSFLLAIPITALAATVILLRLLGQEVDVNWFSFLIGTAASFTTALLAIHYFLKWLNRFGMWPYVVYRLVLAVVLYAFFLG